MIQRIQSLFLSLALLFSAFVFYFFSKFEYVGFFALLFTSNYGFLITPLGAFITLFLFKKRLLQAILCLVLALLQLVQSGIFIYEVVLSGELGLNAILILISLLNFILLLLARKNIRKDEALVRSVDRIR
jgi:hypothetical protein